MTNIGIFLDYRVCLKYDITIWRVGLIASNIVNTEHLLSDDYIKNIEGLITSKNSDCEIIKITKITYMYYKKLRKIAKYYKNYEKLWKVTKITKTTKIT